MREGVRQHWPLLVAVGVLWATVACLVLVTLWRTGGHFAYALDDAYIHAAIARNFAQYGVWGITRHEWSSSSSSLLWTLILALVNRLGVPLDWVPLALNLLSGTMLLALAYALLRRGSRPVLLPTRLILHDPAAPTRRARTLTLDPTLWYPMALLLALLALLFIMPLPMMVVSGMEHTLQATLALPFVYLAAHVVAQDAPRSRSRGVGGLLGLAPLVTLVRYEGLFLIVAAGALLLLRRRGRLAAALMGLGALPIALYAIVSLGHGWFWLPNSVLLKGQAIHGLKELLLTLMGYPALVKLMLSKGAHLYPLLLPPGLALLLVRLRFDGRRGLWEPGQAMVMLVVLILYQHLLLARFTVLYRYEAYIIALSLFVVAWLLLDFLVARLSRASVAVAYGTLPGHAGTALLVLIFLALVGSRGAVALYRAALGPTNIYEQQVQMGRFLDAFYQGSSVAANDIGAINYLADIRCLDLMGLGSLDVAHERQAGTLTTRRIGELARQHDTRIAIVYDQWFTGGSRLTGLPADWIKVGEWTIFHNVVVAGPTVSFYATSAGEAERLAANLREFASQLPVTVKQTGRYTEATAER